MFSVDNFYDYLTHRYNLPAKNSSLWAVAQHGNRDMSALVEWTIPKYPIVMSHDALIHYYSKTTMFDQEPIQFEQMTNSDENTQWLKYYSIAGQLTHLMSSVYCSFICHSEANSPEVKYFTNKGFIDIHYWYHGLISRDWFRHWKHYSTNNEQAPNRFGCYIRDTSGTRQYRKPLLDFIADSNIFCPLHNGKQYSSDASASLEWEDVNNFDIHIVAETLFDTQKTHLTEKVLKPIAMEQPFILFAGPHSLEYMRNYGFQTFASCWDESYDSITNSSERYSALLTLIKDLNQLSPKKYNKIFKRAKLIAMNNREYFYGQLFEDCLLSELHTGFDNAYAKQEELFFTDPGGMYFRAAQKFLGINDPKIHDIRPRNREILKQINTEYPTVAKQIIKKYPNLF